MTDVTALPAKAAAGSSFYVGMRILPREKREAMYAVYAFCRAVDDIADGDAATDDPPAAMDLWRARHRRALCRRRRPDRPRFSRRTSRRFGLKREDFLAIVDGMEMDLRGPVVAPDAATLDLYCDRVASAVGRLSVRIFGMRGARGRRSSPIISGVRCSSPTFCAISTRMPTLGRLYLPREALTGGRHDRAFAARRARASGACGRCA